MARTIRTRVKSALPGAGFDSSGNAKQGKRRVNGAISVTSYTNVGESLTAPDLGLSAIDWISIRHEDQAAGTEGRGARVVNYCSSTSDFYILQTIGAGLEAAVTGSTHALQFDAVGDALDGIELT
jgi:hypothetical protein